MTIETQREEMIEPWAIIALAIQKMREAGIDDCEIGHTLIRAGTTHMEDELSSRGLLRELPNQIEHAHRYLGARLAATLQAKLMDAPRGNVAMH
jgi:hypothetical protein